MQESLINVLFFSFFRNEHFGSAPVSNKGTKEQWKERNERTMEGSKETKEQWEDQRDEKNNGRSKRTLMLKFS